ncbi:hypothetical protein [Rubritalea tangerina]|uniref:hypothetical protein n=1 Tax=Rubritalea tangerina TaxID=430798 RepID=UPI0036243318
MVEKGVHGNVHALLMLEQIALQKRQMMIFGGMLCAGRGLAELLVFWIGLGVFEDWFIFPEVEGGFELFGVFR